jgi:hypothetical protein
VLILNPYPSSATPAGCPPSIRTRSTRQQQTQNSVACAPKLRRKRTACRWCPFGKLA